MTKRKNGDLEKENIIDEYTKYKNKDPFPEIPSALLNSSDIIQYIDKVKMVNPFLPDNKNMKPASIALNVKGTVIFFDEKGKKKEIKLTKNKDEYELKRNTIAFISLSTALNLPHYIAARFNLQIQFVHKGILLGTGPLVDPGFSGNLLIPLHNLTNNDYTIKYDEPLIWMEFTKLSLSPEFKYSMGDVQKGNFYPFKVSSHNLSPADYLAKAAQNTPIVSSVSKLVIEAENLHKMSQETINRFNWLGILSIATLIVGIGTFSYNTSVMNIQNVKDFQKIDDKIQSLNVKLDSIAKLTKSLNMKKDVKR